MLTKRENLLETIKGGNPDRYVNGYEPYELFLDPIIVGIGGFAYVMTPGEKSVNGWGVTVSYPVGNPGPFPLHGAGLTVLEDVTRWKEVVKAPRLVYSEEEWAETKALAAAVDRKEKFVTAFVAPGIFEKLHYLMGMEQTMINFYEEPEAMHELIDYLADWEVEYLKELMKHLNPDALFHHDDWGSQISSFLSPGMFEEFIVPAYKKVYGYAKEQGLLIVHHSDCYAANLVPSMIDIGIDIWQGVMRTNNIPELIEKYGGQISFMGGIDSALVDREDSTPESIAKIVEETCRANGTKYYIPGTSQGGPESHYPNVYETVCLEIDKMSKKMFK